MIRPFSKILIAGVVVILVAGGIFGWQYLGTPKDKVRAPEEITKDETASWQTYRNEEFGFEVRYPKYEENQSCKFQEVSNGSFSLGRIDLDVLNSDGLELGAYVDRFINERTKDPYSYLFGPSRNTEINGQQGISITYRFGGLNRLAEAVFLKKADNIYVISFTAGGFLCNEPEIFDQILATFRFVE